MTSHGPHPSTHMYGLADGCPRCAEHAEHPFESLDSENLRALISRLNLDSPPRSENEARAMRVLETHRRHAEVLARLRNEGAQIS